MRALVVAFAVVATACQTPCPNPVTGSATESFECEDGSSLNVTFLYDLGSARILQDGYPPLELPARLAGYGYRYADNGAVLRQSTEGVRWQRPGSVETVCRRPAQP